MSPRHINEAALQAREDEILDQALAIISTQGAVGLTMDKLVSQLNYSKGTVYKQFSSKEDVLAGLCNRNMRSVLALFRRVVPLAIRSRDKAMAISFAYMLSVLRSPQHFMLVMNAKTELFEKASEQRRQEHGQIDKQLFNIMLGIIEEGIASKELLLSDDLDMQRISFALYAMSFGTIGLLLNGEKDCSNITGLMLADRVIHNANIVMDGLGWSPSGQDQAGLIQWFKSDVFRVEINQLEAQGICL